MKAFFFGCWNEAGHYLFHPGGSSVLRVEGEDAIVHTPHGAHIDGTLAPRKHKFLAKKLCWAAQGATQDARRRLEYDSTEYPQGEFLIHKFNGYTYMSWWDRTQGDTRGACNSTFILEGDHDASAMVAELKKSFPHVVKNLGKAKVSLVEVKP